MKKYIKARVLRVPTKPLTNRMIFPLIDRNISIEFTGLRSAKDTLKLKVTEIIVVYEEKERKFKGF
jgi:hypothetical protein